MQDLDRDVLRGLQASIKPFDGGEGFTAWKDAMLMLMDGYDYLETIMPEKKEASAEADDGGDKKVAESALKSKQAKILLHSCVGPSLKPLVFMAKNASEAWNEI